ncbi:MAG: PAS domain-containing protein [Candidatus Omnitrophota bacterium]
MTIKNKFIAGIFIFTAVFLASSYFTNGISKRRMEIALGENLTAEADHVLSHIESEIYNKVELVQLFLEGLTVQETLAVSNQEFELLGDRQNYIDQQDRDWVAFPLGEESGLMKELINNRLSDELRVRTRFLKEKHGYEVFPEAFITNRYGVNVAQTGRTSDYRQDDEAWWQETKEKGIYISDLAFDDSSGVYSLTIGIRADDSQGNFSGVVKGILNIHDVFANLHEHAGSQIELIDSQGRVLYSDHGSNEIFKALPEHLWKKIRHSTEGGGYFVSAGDIAGEGEEFFAFSFSKGHENFPGLGWILLLEKEKEELLKPMLEMEKQQVVSYIGAGIFLFIFGFLIFTPVINDILSLRDAAAEIGRGNLDSRVSVNSKGEIRLLADTFNQMIEELKKARAALFYEKERLGITLFSIGDGVIAVDKEEKIILVNKVASQMTGWSQDEAMGMPLGEVFNIINEKTRLACENPVIKVLKENRSIDLANDTVLVSKEGKERIISDCAAPIKDSKGEIQGVVLVFRDNTEGRLAQRALEESEERYRMVTSSITDYIYTVYLENGRAVRTVHNPTSESVTGYTPKEFLSSPMLWLEIVPPEEREFLITQIGRFIAGEKVEPLEHRIIHKNGSERWIRSALVPHYNERGVLQSYDGVVSDITDRVLFQRQIVQQNEFLHNVMEALAHPFYVVDAETYKIVMGNSASGYSAGQDVTCYALTHKSGQPCRGSHGCPLSEVKRTGKPVVMQHIHDDERGKARYFEVHGYPIFDREGKVVQMLESSLEVTKRVEAENEARRLLEQMKLILEKMPFGVIIVGKDKKIRRINKAALNMIGIDSEEEILGNICHKCICPAEVGKCPILDLGESVNNAEKMLLTRGGRKKPIFKSVLPMELEGEEVLLETFVDISERIKAEEGLRLAKEEAEKALAVKDEFVSTVSHELRTPLAISKEALSLMLRGKVGILSDKQHEILSMAGSNIDRLAVLINDILDISKIEAGKMELRKEEVDVIPIVSQCCKEWELEAQAKKVKLSLGVPDKKVILCVDKARFLQILSNLMNNAFKFTPQGGSVSVLLEEMPYAVKFSVVDTGHGIASEDIPNLFQKFKQMGRVSGAGAKGTGLGLSIVKSLVLLHGGKVEVKSESGKGSNFSFTIPKATV